MSTENASDSKIRRVLRIKTIVKIAIQIFVIATIIYAYKTRQSHGKFCGVPFEFRVPTIQRIKQRWWNKGDSRIFTEHFFGIGWSINMYQVLEKTGVRRAIKDRL